MDQFLLTTIPCHFMGTCHIGHPSGKSLYFKVLPFLGINGNIKKEWRSLPPMFQGLGLPSFSLISLAKKITFLRENWGLPGVAQSDALSLAHDFVMEVGLYGNLFGWDYDVYGTLSTPSTWFSNLWQLSHFYRATIMINEKG
jgi:hypothetical protein